MERTILVAEDSRTQAERLRLLLEGEGYRVDVVGNGREGLQRVQSAPPNLIISDVVMPLMDGYAFCREIKSSPLTRRIPFVILTERRTPMDIVKGLERGADNFITKPFEDAYLLERVRRIFEQLAHREQGQFEMEVSLRVGQQQILLSADKQQIIELLFSTFEELCRINDHLAESQRQVEAYAQGLEAQVRERTQALLQSEKLAAMGHLLAGVAHELNNPLAVILGQAMLLGAEIGEGAPAARTRKIGEAAERCARIVRSFLALAREQRPERKTVDLNQVIREAVELLGYQLRVDSVEVRLELAPGLPAIWADPNQLHQVVVNLITNAHQAMREAPPPWRIILSTAFDGRRELVGLTVSDTGPGIPSDIRHRIFEPFFTTKPPGQGTGLGLSLCHGIVQDHGGAISVESPPGDGAVFVIELPAGVPTTAEPAAKVDVEPPPVRGKRILVVDDEPDAADVLADILASDGHTVDTAPNGRVALDRLGQHAYDLVLSDIKMPEMDGPHLLAEIERRHPHLARRFIFITGDVLGSETRGVLDRTQGPAVSKPYDLPDVRRTIRRVLQDAGGEASRSRQV